MTDQDIERLKKVIQDKKNKGNFFTDEKKIGVGKVQKSHRSIGLEFERSEKISY